MPYQVRCKVAGFMSSAKQFPCHFFYKVGEEFIYDGEKFVGGVCGGVWTGDGFEVIYRVHTSGLKSFEYNPVMYAGAMKVDPSMKKHDGVGYKNIKGAPEGASKPAVELGLYPWSHPIPEKKRAIAEFHCPDPRTSVAFIVEPFDLSDKGRDIPCYNREMSILEKLKAEPGMTPDGILKKFSQFEREEIYPVLGPALIGVFLEELETVGYVENKNGKFYPTAKGKAKSTDMKFAD